MLVEDGGALLGNVVQGCVTVRGEDTGPIALAGVEMLSCEQAGLAAEEAGDHFSELVGLVFGDTEVGMSLHPESVANVASQMSYTDVDRNEIAPGTLVTDATWIGQDVPWRVGPSVNAEIIGVEAALTLEAGFTLEFLRERPVAAGVEVGVDAPGALIANGTEEAPVVFRSGEETPAAGDWGSIEFAENTGAGTDLVNVSVSGAGADGRGVFRLTDTAGNVRIESPELDTNTDPTVLCRGDDAPELLSFPGGAILSGCP